MKIHMKSIRISFFLLGSLSVSLIANGKQKDMPNIVLIYADDLGYSDISCYGQIYGNTLVKTPNIDRLAKEGMMFTNAYSAAPISTAARAGLLTGQFPARLGIEFVTSYEKNAVSWDSDEWNEKFKDKVLLPPPITLHLPLEATTVAEMLKKNGYTTGIVGKWHVAAHEKKYKGWSPFYGPNRRGFNWTKETYGSHTYSGRQERSEDEAYPSDEVTQEAIEFLKQKHETPFFLYVSHYYVHSPVQVKSEALLSKYRLKMKDGYSEKQIEYAAFLDRFDHYVGQLLDVIDQEGYTDNTMIIFTSDNGGNPMYAFNRPFRGSKWNLYEGGIRLPLIVKWQGKIDSGAVCDIPVIQLDLMPTFLDMINGDNKYLKMDGQSLIPIFEKGNLTSLLDRSFIWHFPYYHPEGDAYYLAKEQIGIEDEQVSRTKPQSAIRKGIYKLIYFYEENRSELYNLENDPSEQTNLASCEIELTNQLTKELLAKLENMNARIPRKK